MQTHISVIIPAHNEEKYIARCIRSIKKSASLFKGNVEGAKYAAVISQEKIWVTSEKDVYNDIIFDSTWTKLQDADEFMKLRKLLDKR